MATTVDHSWQHAKREPFEAFGILYYPLFVRRDDLAGIALEDEDMAWAVTANANLEGTGYTLSQPSILSLAAYHRVMADLASKSPLLPIAQAAAEGGINPRADLNLLVPDVTATPMYPDFPKQVMEISEAEFRYHQACHYFSTYGVELIAGLFGLDVTVSKGWLPDVESTPKVREDDELMAPKVLHVLLTVEDLQSVVAARLARATRMHPEEIATTLLVFEGLEGKANEVAFPKVAFHENMMELIRVAAGRDSRTLERVATGLAQHPGDLLKAIHYVLATNRVGHLATRQKKGFCRAFEHFGKRSIAQNLVDASGKIRHMPNYLSLARFGGPCLREAIRMVECGEVRSWASELELLWDAVDGFKQVDSQPPKDVDGFFSGFFAHGARPSSQVHEDVYLDAWNALLAHYGKRPGMLFRSFGRLIKGGCPDDLLVACAKAHATSYAIPTLVRTLLSMSDRGTPYRVVRTSRASFDIVAEDIDTEARKVRARLCPLLRELLVVRLSELDTPLRNKRIFLDTAGISLRGSVLVPNETGNTGTAWPPVGMAWDLPQNKTIRFFTYWDDRSKRVDVDLHFIGRMINGEGFHLGWNSEFRSRGMMTSGDITTSEDSVEFLDANLKTGIDSNVYFVVQEQHIFMGASNWRDIQTCYSGATIVSKTGRDVKLIDRKNLIFSDDLTGVGSYMPYAVVNFPGHYVRILRGADVPIGDVDFCLGNYLEALFEAQGTTLVGSPDEAEVRVCIGRSDDAEVVSLFDEGFFVG